MKALGRLLMLAALAVLARPASAERVVLEGTGTSIERPSGWIQISAAQNLSAAERSGFGNQQLRGGMRQALEAGPFVSFAKPTGRHANVTPVVRLHVRPRMDLAGRTLTEMERRSLELLAQSFPDVRFVDEPAETARFGSGGAVMRIAYTLGSGANAVTVQTRSWLVERGDRLISVSITMADDEGDAVWREAEAILDTIRIDQP